MAYAAQGTNPQCMNDQIYACRTLPGVPGCVRPWMVAGFLTKWYSGSAVEKVSMPMPMPAPNIIENHEKFENSGLIVRQAEPQAAGRGQTASTRHRIKKNAAA